MIGTLIAFEGIDGSGKSTQARLLAEALSARGLDVVATREPTDGPWGRRARAAARDGRLGPGEELECFLRDRVQHVAEVIGPALARGAVVIVDRYVASTIAYQGARGLDPEELVRRNAFAPPPNLTVLLDLDPRIAVARIRARGGGAGDALEQLDVLARARGIYFGAVGAGALVVDATLPQGELAAIVFGVTSVTLAR